MTRRTPYRPVLNKPVLVGGIEFRFAGIAFMFNAVTWVVLFRSFGFAWSVLIGALVFVGWTAFGRWCAAKDPQMPQILAQSLRDKRSYDAKAHEPQAASWK
jgi:type IV secretory pathway TrbD component